MTRSSKGYRWGNRKPRRLTAREREHWYHEVERLRRLNRRVLGERVIVSRPCQYPREMREGRVLTRVEFDENAWMAHVEPRLFK